MANPADRERIRSELAGLEGAVAAVGALRGRSDAERLRELVTARRDLADRVAALRRSGAEAFAGDPALADEFRKRLSALLHEMATHQANWPAVAIEEGRADYAASAQRVSAAHRNFIAWARDQLR